MLDTGTYGAKVQSWHKANPRDLLKRLIEDGPGTDRAALLLKLRNELLSDDGVDYIDAVIEYWFSNNYHSLVSSHKSPAEKQAEKRERVASAKSAQSIIQTRIREEAEIILLDAVTLPSGKSLRDSTGKECAAAGGWLSRIAEKIKPGQKVGVALTEAEVRALRQSA